MADGTGCVAIAACTLRWYRPARSPVGAPDGERAGDGERCGAGFVPAGMTRTRVLDLVISERALWSPPKGDAVTAIPHAWFALAKLSCGLHCPRCSRAPGRYTVRCDRFGP